MRSIKLVARPWKQYILNVLLPNRRFFSFTTIIWFLISGDSTYCISDHLIKPVLTKIPFWYICCGWRSNHANRINAINEYKNERESDSKTTQLLESELEQLNEALGKTDVEGEGIVIQLTDKGGTQLSDDVQVDNITSTQLLTIINELFSAGADAISLNGHRITAMSAVYEIGTEFLKVNGDKITSPYIINAIGDSDYLKSAVSGKGGGVDQLKELGHETSVDTSKKIKIEKYDKDMTSKYIN